MPNVTKLVDRSIPILSRTVNFTQADAKAGDILLFQESLGKAAHSLAIESAGGMTIRLNVYVTVFPQRQGNDLMITEGMPNLALGQKVKVDTQALITIAANETFSINDGLAIKDLEIVSVTGNFDILAY